MVKLLASLTLQEDNVNPTTFAHFLAPASQTRCLKITQKVAFEFSIFALSTIFVHLYVQNVNVARIARHVECDFFCHFHTPWLGCKMTNCICGIVSSFQGNGSSSSQKYETNVNVIPENPEDCLQDDNDDEDNVNNVSRMTINTCKIIPVNTQIESSNSQPEDFDLVSHPSLVIQGMNQLRNSGQLLDVKLVAEGKTFKVRIIIIFYLFVFCLTWSKCQK